MCTKSNAVYTAYKAALADAQMQPDYDVPAHLRNAPTKLLKELGAGKSIAMLMTKKMLMQPVRFISHLKCNIPNITTQRIVV